MDVKDITDLDIQALIDGELSDGRRLDLLDRIRNSPVLYSRYIAYKKQKELLKLWWKDN